MYLSVSPPFFHIIKDSGITDPIYLMEFNETASDENAYYYVRIGCTATDYDDIYSECS